MQTASAMPRVAALFTIFGITLAARVTMEVDSQSKARDSHRKAHEKASLEARKPFLNDFDKLISSTSADLGRLTQIDKSGTKASTSFDSTTTLSLVQVTLSNFQRRFQKVQGTNTERKKVLQGSWEDLKKQREQWRKAVPAGAVAETYELAESRLTQQQKFSERVHTALVQVSQEGINKLKNLKAALNTAVAEKKPIVTGRKPKEPKPEVLLQAKDLAKWARRASGALKAAQGYRA
jgi:hypothetical protein